MMAYVYKKINEYQIPTRDLKSARSLALEREKLKFVRTDDDGQKSTVILQKNEVDENFFSSL